MASPINKVNGFMTRRQSSASSSIPIAQALATHPSQADPYNPATSPTSGSNSQSATSPHANRSRKASNLPMAKALTEFTAGSDGSMEETKKGVKALLLENVNESGVALLRGQNYVVDTEKASLSEDDLIKRLREGQYQILGIRSKTKVTRKVIESCTNLLVIGCFCIGTNQVDLLAAAKAGVAVFNSPFSNSRSVAELVIGEVIALSRQLCDRAMEMRQGVWNKVSKGCWEVRGKTLGIVGYGHIGSQLSVLAESMAMDVIYYDVVPLMPLGSAQQVGTLEDLLKQSDFVTLHVPELPETTNLIGATELKQMKKGSYLLNNARGKVVDLPALVDALKSGHLAGAAVDVFPKEPAGNGAFFNDNMNGFESALRDCPNVMLTPHIGGSTEEAQRMIGAEVSTALTRYINFGSSLGAVNFPEVNLRPIIGDKVVRVCYVHSNQPGVLKQVNAILGDFNVERQLSDSKGDIAYLMADIADVSQQKVKDIYSAINSTGANIRSRVLY